MFNERFQRKTAALIIKREESTAIKEQMFFEALRSVMEDGVKELMERRDVQEATTGILSVVKTIRKMT